jgi:hypothetical protein
MHFWIALGGSSEFALRLFSVVTGLVALCISGWAARQISPSSGAARGLAAAFLLAIMPGLVFYARTARMYALGVVWIALSGGLFLRDWVNRKEGPNGKGLILLGVTHGLALFTHYYLLLPILVQPLVLLTGKRWHTLKAWIALHGGLALVGLVWLWISPGLQVTTRGFRLFFHLPAPADVANILRLLIFSQEVRPPFPFLFGVLAFAGLGILLAAVEGRKAVAFWLLGSILVPLGLAYQLPRIPAERYILFLLPFFALSMGVLATFPFRFRPSLLRWGLVLVLSGGMGGMLATNGLAHVLNPEVGGYGHTIRQVRNCFRPGDGLLFYGPWQSLLFQYYNPGGLPSPILLPPYAPPTLTLEEAQPVLEDLMAHHERLWVVFAAVDDVDPHHFAEGWLNAHAHPVWRTHDFALYFPILPSDVLSQTIPIVFGNTLRLERVAWESGVVPAGEPLRFTLYWTLLQPISNDVRVGFILQDASGRTWVEKYYIPGEWAYSPSRWQVGEQVADHQGVLIPPGAPPGKYTLRIAFVADHETGETLTPAVEPVLFSVTVEEPLVSCAAQGISCALPEPDTMAFCAPDGTDCLTLAGAGSPQVVYPGYPIPVTLHWIAPLSPISDSDLTLRLHLKYKWSLLRNGTPVSFTVPLSPDYPPARWTPGRLVTTMLQFSLPANAPAGAVQLQLEVLGPDGVPWQTSEGQEMLSLLSLNVKQRSVLRRMPSGMSRIHAIFGDVIELRGYRIEGNPQPGGTLRLTYVWYARQQPTRIYAVFNHLMTPEGTLVAQVDGWPQEGRVLTTQWLPGEYVVDHYVLNIPADAPSGPYRLFIGYTMQRRGNGCLPLRMAGVCRMIGFFSFHKTAIYWPSHFVTIQPVRL